MTGHPSAEDLEAQQINQQLRETQDRLVLHYANHFEISEDHVRGTFEAIQSRFADATIRSFLPILIERAVQHELGR
jgi:hypothetical protein